MNVFGHIEFGENGAVHEESASSGPNAPADAVAPVPEDQSPIVREMREIVSGMTPKNSGESYNDAVAKKEQALTMFKLGILGLEERAAVEGRLWRICYVFSDYYKKLKHVPGYT